MLRLRAAASLGRNTGLNNLRRFFWDLTENLPLPESRRELKGWLFVDSVFPVRMGRFDIRHYIGAFREETLLANLKARLSTVKTHNFEIISLEPHQKDGGVFVQFKYNADVPDSALASIENELKEEAQKHGGLPSWIGLSRGNVWLVKGRPWREDMNRFASPIVRVSFSGPDVQEQQLYQIFRPYGRIQDLTLPAPVPVGTLRSTVITFQRVRSAAIARNVVHGLDVISGDNTMTHLRTTYQQPIQARVIRDWLSRHPKIVLPVIVFLLGTLTYTIFDPIRVLMVQGRMLDWFDYREFMAYKWLRANTVERLSFTSSSITAHLPTEEVWKERKEAKSALRNYLSDLPSTVAFIHGPQGSGKSRLLTAVLRQTDRKTLMIDCRELYKTTSDTQLVSELAGQTGYWPMFTFLNSMNNIIDLASVGLIGQKAGLSNSLAEQLQQILEVVGTGLKGVSASHRAASQRKIKRERQREAQEGQVSLRRENIRRGTFHDGRLDCVAGNGIMSELGIGDEIMTNADANVVEGRSGVVEGEQDADISIQDKVVGGRIVRRQRTVEDIHVVESLPIVVISNYAAKGGSSREGLVGVLAQWAAVLVENQIAHVVVISDNRENAKQLAKALPSKPLNSIALYDADASSALSFVKQKIQEAGISLDYTQAQVAYVKRLGGRASDLESLIRRVRSGQGVEEAVEDIINKSVGELRKNAFGDDIEDSKNLPWSREQAWAVLRLLSERTEIPYHNLLLDFPFKGDENALKNMEQADLISISTHHGRPSIIRPGRPVYKYVFGRLVEDPIFQATQDIAFNEKIISGSENVIKACEQEITTLKEIGTESSHWWGGRTASSMRAAYLFDKMLTAETKIEALEKRNLDLKRVLSKGG